MKTTSFRALKLALATLLTLALVFALGGCDKDAEPARQAPLRVMLIPADGGTATGTLADFAPLFKAVGEQTGLEFDLRVGQSYSAVVEAMKAGLVDVAWLGPVAYVQARDAGAAELLAVSVLDEQSVYYAAIFVPRDSPVTSIEQLRGKSVAFGDVNSGSSFTYQVAMMLEKGLDPARDLGAIRLTGSHAASLSALAEGQVDAACLSFESYVRALDSGIIEADAFRVLARSNPIPNPPMALHTGLPAPLKQALKEAFGRVHETAAATPELIRGYGGKRVDRYDANFPESAFDGPARTLSRIDDEVRAAMLRKAGAQ